MPRPPVTRTGNVVLRTQADVDAFARDCPEIITGCLTIGGLVEASNITSLAGLEPLTTIGKDLIVWRCPLLASLAGLRNVASVGRQILESSVIKQPAFTRTEFAELKVRVGR